MKLRSTYAVAYLLVAACCLPACGDPDAEFVPPSDTQDAAPDQTGSDSGAGGKGGGGGASSQGGSAGQAGSGGSEGGVGGSAGSAGSSGSAGSAGSSGSAGSAGSSGSGGDDAGVGGSAGEEAGAGDADAGPPPSLTIAAATIAEGNSGQSTVTFTVTLSEASTSVVTVDYSTADGTATTSNTAPGGSDYATATGTLTFEAGDLSKTFSVAVNGDPTFEDDETFSVNLSNAANATIATGTSTGTVTNDDSPPLIAIDSVSLNEGNSGASNATLTVTLNPPSGKQATVVYDTADGTATAGGGAPSVGGQDYVPSTGTLTFGPGETTKTIGITLNGDELTEADETCAVNLSSPTNATLADGKSTGTATILNDDSGLPILWISPPVAVAEGNAGTQLLTFNVEVLGYRTNDITVDFATKDGVGKNAASAGQDYVPSSGTLTFAPADTTKTIVVSVNGDTLDEDDETFDVVLSNPVNGQIMTSTAAATITDDDAAPTVTINDVTIKEGASGSQSLSFNVSLSSPSGKTVTVGYGSEDGSGVDGATVGGTASTGGLDYQKAAGTITFAPGASSENVVVYVNGDTLNEMDEKLLLALSAPTNADLGAKASGVGTIVNDDPVPVLTISDVKVTEGNSGTTFAAFAMSLSAPSGRTVTANWATQDGTGLNPAKLADKDYLAATGTVTFAPGSTSPQPVVVQVNGDTTTEASETFHVKLSAPVGATISGTGIATGTILNDDGQVTFINVASALTHEPDTGMTATMNFTVSLSQPVPVGKVFTVNYATAPYPSGLQAATSGVDYVPATGTLSFAAGEQSKTVGVTVNGDVLSEYSELFYLNLSNSSVGTEIQDGQGVGTIVDNDPFPVISVVYTGPKTLLEGGTGETKSAQFGVSLSTASARYVYVNYATADGQAQSGGMLVSGGQDYVAASSQLTLLPGETVRSVNVTINGDNTFETNESFALSLSGAINGTVSATAGTASAMIVNDDTVPIVSIDSVSMKEGTPPVGGTLQTPMKFTVTLSNPTSASATVSVASKNGTACAPTAMILCKLQDYVPIALKTLTFAPGTTAIPVNVMIYGDSVVENDETLFMNLSAPVSATLSTTANAGTGTIVNDDTIIIP